MEGYGYGYEKFNRRQEDWAMVAVSALVKKGGDGTCADVRIGLTHMGSVPLRATAVEDALRGQPLTADTIAAASERRPRAPSRPPISTPPRTTSATWRGCCASGR